MSKKFLLTKTGLADLTLEYDKLTKVLRPAIADRINRAREFGDLAENSEYDAAKEEQSLLEARISELEAALHGARVIEEAAKTDFVMIGSTIVVEIEGHTDQFTVVGTMEADPAKRKISNESPVGQALLGAKIGDIVEVTTPIIKAKYRILEVK
ncbi:MAG TPA: transcription elongation factor GreA [Candidatus Saccharimonadales bacterium]|nr:transcription elongation factor GreA [Candidatus Saccharimonadales bacterium]